MEELIKEINQKKFMENLFKELEKLPFGSLPKSELELVIFHSIIEAYGGYNKLNKITPALQKRLKLTQTKFKNKVLQAQLRYSDEEYNSKEYLKEIILRKDITELTVEGEYLILIISNPMQLDNIKTFFDSKEIINDTSFNKNILKINIRGVLKVLATILDDRGLRKIESKLKEYKGIDNKSFSLVGDIKINSIFSAGISIEPLKGITNLIEFIRKVL